MVETFDPAPGLLIVVNVMLGSAALSLSFPETQKPVFIEHMPLVFRPFTERFAAGPVNWSETAQLAELLRELRDFR